MFKKLSLFIVSLLSVIGLSAAEPQPPSIMMTVVEQGTNNRLQVTSISMTPADDSLALVGWLNCMLFPSKYGVYELTFDVECREDPVYIKFNVFIDSQGILQCQKVTGQNFNVHMDLARLGYGSIFMTVEI